MNSLGLEAGSQLTLVYGDVRILGTFRVGSRRGEVVVGEFEAGADFARAAPLFREFEDLVVDQVFSLVSSAAERIDGLRIRIGDPGELSGLRITDVQLWRDGSASFRLLLDASTQTASDSR